MVKTFKIFGRELFAWGDVEEETSKIKRSVKRSVGLNESLYDMSSIGMDVLRRTAEREPLIRKAIMKKNMDSVRNWFVLKPSDGSETVSKRVLNLISKFDKRSNIQFKFYLAGVCADIYGTGFLERTFMESGNIDASSDINIKKVPLSLNIINPEFIRQRKRKDDKDKILYWLYKENMMDDVYIHPNRLIDIAHDRLPNSYFGLSKISLLYNILTSKVNADVAAGETLAWFSHGILDMTIEGMQDDQEEEMIKLYKQHPSCYVHDEDYEFKVHNPEQINPQPFYDYFYVNIAAAMNMPTHMLTGVQLGNVTGSEVGMGDYVHDVENIQTVLYTPIIEKVYKQLLESSGLDWKYDIVWNPIFIDELSEGKITQVRSYSAVNSFNAGIIDAKEARMILNNGVIDLDVNKKIEKPVEEKPVDQPNVEPQPADKKPTVKQNIYPLNDSNRKMIEAAVMRERILGEQILREQEEEENRVKQVENNNKKNNRKNKK